MDMDVKISELPPCNIRMGRFYDGKAVIACGFREIEPSECIECGGNKIVGNSKKWRR